MQFIAGTFKQMAWAAGIACLGGVVGGRRGALLGSIAGENHHFNPLVTNGLSHHYHLDRSTFIFRGISEVFFLFLFHFSMKVM